MTDIVYIVRSGEQNEELRYSLRSLENIPHSQVHISGFSPSWITSAVNKIPVAAHSNKYRSAEQNLQAAIDSADVSDPFLLFNDDFFLLKKMKQIPVLHRGLLSEVIDYYQKKHSGEYLQGMQHALKLLQSLGVEEPLYSYEMHSPLLVKKRAMEEVLALRQKQNCYHLRTVYGNLEKIGGSKSEDVKVYRKSVDTSTWTKRRMLSTSDMVWAYSKVGRYVRDLFPVPSQYER